MTTTPTRAAELPEALRVPLDSIHADAGYLCGRLLNGSLTQEQVVASIRRRIDAAKLAAQALSAAQAGAPAVKQVPDTRVPEAWKNLLAYVLQDDMHNRLTPRVIDIAYTAFMQAKRPNDEDGGASDWFNDTRPAVKEMIAKLRKDLIEELAAAPQPEAKALHDGDAMALAESVGLIGPASRVGDLHNAIQRYHDLICANATIKAAKMAADAIAAVKAQPIPVPENYPPLPMQFACSGVFAVYSADQMRAYVDADRAARAAPQPPAAAPAEVDAPDAARTAWLNANDMAALERLDEVFQDGEGYDVPAAQMKRMAEIGVVRHHSAGRYSITSFGRWVLGSRLLRQPLETIAECNARLGEEHRAALAAQKGGA